MKCIRVLMADDHKLFIDGIGGIIDRQMGMEVVGAARDGLTACRLAEELGPDVILMDVSMPQLNGIEATQRILAQHPQVGVIMLSMHADRRFVLQSLRAGARGYLLKDAAAEELLEAITRVAAGELYLSGAMSSRIIQEYVETVKADEASAYRVLTPREREVLQLIAEGHPTKEIAGTLALSVKTIETHRKQVMDKLDLHSVAELTKYAIREGLTQVD